jgi:hypothetical protein
VRVVVANPEVGASPGHQPEEDPRLSAAELLLLRQGTPRVLLNQGYVPENYRFTAIPDAYRWTLDDYVARRISQMIDQGVPQDQLPHETTLWAGEILFGDPKEENPDPKMPWAVKVARAKHRRLGILRMDAWWHASFYRRQAAFGEMIAVIDSGRIAPGEPVAFEKKPLIEETRTPQPSRSRGPASGSLAAFAAVFHYQENIGLDRLAPTPQAAKLLIHHASRHGLPDAESINDRALLSIIDIALKAKNIPLIPDE